MIMQRTKVFQDKIDIGRCGVSANETTLHPIDIGRCGVSANETTLHPNNNF